MVEKLTELFEQARTEQAQNSSRKLAPERHPNRDFFVADILDYALKNDRHSMEHPFFSLSKKPDHRVRQYERNGAQVIVKPGPDGMATIWDKDVLIYAISQLVEALNQGRPVSRRIRLTAYDFLVTTNRHTGGENYKRLRACFARLAGTRIETNIATNGRRISRGFGLIDSWEIVERTADGGIATVQVTLNEWLYNAILGREVLTLNRDYFRLDSGLDRRLYEIARKHCGQQPQWSISTALLRTKSGSTASLKRFRQQIKAATSDNALPDYRLTYQADSDQVTFERRPPLSVH